MGYTHFLHACRDADFYTAPESAPAAQAAPAKQQSGRAGGKPSATQPFAAQDGFVENQDVGDQLQGAQQPHGFQGGNGSPQRR